jgi:hypothetical protein
MKDGLCGKPFANVVIVAIMEWLLETDSIVYERGMQALVQQ